MGLRTWRLLVMLPALAVLTFGCTSKSHSPCGPGWPPSEYPPHGDDSVTIVQGVWGYVRFWAGDFMPPCPSGTVTPVAREMRIHELTSIDDVESPGPGAFYSAIHTELVATATSDSSGFFEIELAPGSYSVFAVEDTLFYANRFDGAGNIWPVSVTEGEATAITFNIDYLSTW